MIKILKYSWFGIKVVLFFLFFMFYFFLTINERDRYIHAKNKGMDCFKCDIGLTSSIYHFDPNKKPKKEFLSFKDFKKLHFPKLNL